MSDESYGGCYPSSYDGEMFPTDGMGAIPYGFLGYGVATTADPAPAGDVKIHAAPDATSAQVGAIDKDAVVAIDGASTDPAWVAVTWTGSTRNPAAKGFASADYLQPVGQPGPAPGPAPAPSAPHTFGISPLYLGIGAAALLLGGWAAYKYL